MRLTALADLPNGVKTGEHFDVPEYQGLLLMRAKVATSDDPMITVDETEPVSPPPEPTRRSARTYRRQDLTADRTASPTTEGDGE